MFSLFCQEIYIIAYNVFSNLFIACYKEFFMIRNFVIRNFVHKEFSALGNMLLRNFVIRNFVIRNFVPAPMQNMRNKSVFALGYLIASCSFQKGKSL